ncbi:MAG: 4Fe-4S binding protein [Candidatus Gracilibacteria bacterium]|nr:4Fe-4S binding protein [Candidatus Gracilibacteria bacterium]
MPIIIDSNCTYCGACQEVCPRGAIIAGDTQFQIDNDLCDECQGSPKCIPVCPEKCITKISMERLADLES